MQNIQCSSKQQQKLSKVFTRKNGKISLSSSSVSNQISIKNHQIFNLKKQIYDLHKNLENQRQKTKNFVVLTAQIKKVKQKLIEKVRKKEEDERQNVMRISEQEDQDLSNLQMFIKQRKQKQSDSRRQRDMRVVSKDLKQSLQNPFRNFSLYNSHRLQNSQFKSGIQPSSFQNNYSQHKSNNTSTISKQQSQTHTQKNPNPKSIYHIYSGEITNQIIFPVVKTLKYHHSKSNMKNRNNYQEQFQITKQIRRKCSQSEETEKKFSLSREVVAAWKSNVDRKKGRSLKMDTYNQQNCADKS